MNTRLTVADVRAALTPQFPNFDISKLNEICERIIYSGKWKGAVLEVDFPSADGYVTLPYEMLAALCLTYDTAPVLAFSQFHQYQINGPGNIDQTRQWPGVLIDLGDGFAVQTDITTAGTLRVYTDAADNGKTILINGLDQNGNPVFAANGSLGESVVCAAPFVTTTNQFSAVTGIQATPDPTIVMQKGWTLYSNGDAATIGTYWPGQSRPMFRRYQTGQADKTIRMLCQRRFIPVRNESDWVIPGNLGALRAGMWMWNFENGSDVQQAQVAWQQCLMWLNNEAKIARGGIIPSTAFVNWAALGGCGGGSSYNSGYGGLVTT